MPTYTFNKENHFALVNAGYEIQKEGYNSDGDVVVVYYNQHTITRMGLVRPDDASYTGIVPKWELEEVNTTALPQPQDIAMEDFRKACCLVAGCKVSADGKMMTYNLKSVADMTTWLACANSIIITHKLPLEAKTQARMKGKEVESVQLRIIYKPQL